jgi:ribonuclease-3
MEYFGDKVVKLVISFYLMHRYHPKQNQGFMTKLQTKLEDKKNLAKMAMDLEFGKYFIIASQIEQINGRNSERFHEDVFEAFMGALFMSNGFEVCCLFLVNLLETTIDYSEKLYNHGNHKDQLLRYFHQQKWNFPQWVDIHSEGPPNKRTFIVGVKKHNATDSQHFKEMCISFGKGNSKRDAEQNAAKMALIILGLLNKDQYKDTDLFYPDWNTIDSVANDEDTKDLINSILVES